jgi:hypothetical protein
MKAKEANQIPISSYLKHLGINPSRIKGDCCFYASPYRNENTPSFKVNLEKNIWVDYGDGNAGGTLIDLVLKMNPSFGISEAIQQISDMHGHSFSLHQQYLSTPIPTHNKISILNTKPLVNNQAITEYLHSRGIKLGTAKDYCKEVYYSIGGKRYFGLGNEHENGWAIRNRYWKGCTAQGISHYHNRSDELCLFEGIFDLLSYLEMNKQNKFTHDFMVLNSLANLKGALAEIKKYKQVELYLDRDKAGMEAAENLKLALPQCLDQGEFMMPFKDLNEYWINRDQQVVKR